MSAVMGGNGTATGSASPSSFWGFLGQVANALLEKEKIEEKTKVEREKVRQWRLWNRELMYIGLGLLGVALLLKLRR